MDIVSRILDVAVDTFGASPFDLPVFSNFSRFGYSS